MTKEKLGEINNSDKGGISCFTAEESNCLGLKGNSYSGQMSSVRKEQQTFLLVGGRGDKKGREDESVTTGIRTGTGKLTVTVVCW